MSTFLQISMWTAVGLVFYCYVGYPILLGVLVRLFAKAPKENSGPSSSKNDQELPFVSIIIAAYKEESVILQRLQNAVLMDYPADRYEILIGCDGDEDTTGELVAGFDDSRVKLCQYPKRRGKPSVLNDTVPQAQGEILAFSDANTFWEPNAIRQLVRHFQEDQQVGGVCGQLRLTDPHTGENVDGMYWKFENILKRWEGRFGSLLGFNGAIYAIRKELWEPIPPNSIVDDFLIGMRLHLNRHKIVFDETAIANEESAPTIGAEFHRRARIGAGGFQSLCWLSPLLSPKYGSVCFAFWSHKVLRWLCPMFLAVAFITNLCLLDSFVYQLTMLAQCGFYGVAILGRYLQGAGKVTRLTRLTTMFTEMNLALSVGFWRWASNRQSGAWKRTARSKELTKPEISEETREKELV
ncbi:glycosyltransferase family 2 protein [Thalassoglobus sp.]|uniref:glycosyltransferase family 2 protein n=1 Tax=Thalassoglobus sp. TaxID=2795869 RepID=UPI003AA82D5F